jgi:hypothetical protein
VFRQLEAIEREVKLRLRYAAPIPDKYADETIVLELTSQDKANLYQPTPILAVLLVKTENGKMPGITLTEGAYGGAGLVAPEVENKMIPVSRFEVAVQADLQLSFKVDFMGMALQAENVSYRLEGERILLDAESVNAQLMGTDANPTALRQAHPTCRSVVTDWRLEGKEGIIMAVFRVLDSNNQETDLLIQTSTAIKA